MTTFLTVLAIVYFGIGLVVYAVTDTTAFARKIERKLVLPSLGPIQKNLFLFVVVLWPVWLGINATAND